MIYNIQGVIKKVDSFKFKLSKPLKYRISLNLRLK